MRAYLALLPLLLATIAHAGTTPMAINIREGRAALVAGQPGQARLLFAAALAHPDGEREDAYAAAMGLGQAVLWLGDYPAAETAFRMARAHAADEPARQAADTGLAQSLNAQDRPRAAYALVTPFAKGQLRPTVQLLRAAQSLGWQDRSTAYLQAVSPPPGSGRVDRQYRLLHDDMRYALAPRLEGSLGYSHDNEGLSVYTIGSAFRFATFATGAWAQAWGLAAESNRVADEQLARRVNRLSVTSQWRIGDLHQVDLELGPGRAGGWQYLQGHVSWALQPGDNLGFNAAVERAPLLSVAAIDHRLSYDTFSLGANLRPSTHWYVLPAAYRQEFSDGNRRDGGSLRILLSPCDIPDTKAAVGAELSARAFRSSRPGRGIYFNPERYRMAQFSLVGVYALNPGWKLRATAGAGRQFIDGAPASIYAANLSLDGRLPHNGRLRFALGRSSAASSVSTGSAGYWNNTFMLSVGYPL
jgi:hypothetical protein